MATENFWADEFYAEELFAPNFWADQFRLPPIPQPAGIKARPVAPYSVIELDLPICTRTYGIAPCTAKLGGTVVVNITGITITFESFTGYVIDVQTNVAHNLVEGGYVDISGVVATGDYNINGEQAVTKVLTTTKFRVPFSGTTPTGSYTSGGTFSASVLNATGLKKCFNTIRTCQDRPHFHAETKTLRFCEPNGEQIFTKDSQPLVVIPSVSGVGVTPSALHPGVDIGIRESVKITFKDHPHSDAGLDKYIEERDYNPFDQGTFWGKLRARNRSLEGYALRVVRGQQGDDLTEANVYHYVIDSIVSQNEVCTISAKDFLILTDRKKAQCPRISNGVLSGNIGELASNFTLLPVGVGDSEYPLSGKVAIGGEEIVSFTRSGDVMTIVRGQSGTQPSSHDEGDLVQLVKIYDGQGPADIIYNLLTQFCPGIDPDWINMEEWEVEVDEYIGRLYSAEIAEPTSVVDLINELIEQVGLVFWADPLTTQIKLRSLRPVTTGSKAYTGDHMMPSLQVTEQPQLRVSEAWTYYGIRNPLDDLDDPKNYRLAVATVDVEALQDYEHPAIKKIFSRWIIASNRTAATRLNSVILSRYRDPPRKFKFRLFSTIEKIPTLAAGVQLNSYQLQDDEGATGNVPIQITSVEVSEDEFAVEAQEALFASEQEDLVDETKVLFIDDTVFNINLRTLYDNIYTAPEVGDEIRIIISSTGLVASNSYDRPALHVGSWPEGVSLELVLNAGAEIIGRGGDGASVGNGVSTSNKPATDGSDALKTRVPITIKNNGKIRSGGGGGGSGAEITVGWILDLHIEGAGGGGGAGHRPGLGGEFHGKSGGFNAGGASYSYAGQNSTSGAGGAPGHAGNSGNGTLAPGDEGRAIDGESFVTYTKVGTITGRRVN